VQTRRDQLQAYRFQNRRALAALVAGEPNVVEPPMRRLTVLTVSGIMIAILIAVGFALLGVFKPTAGDKWKDQGVVVVEEETGARYVMLDGRLHPALNFTSAVLAAANKSAPNVVSVERDEIQGAKRGSTIGIAGLPDSLPPASKLAAFPWTLCSIQQGNSTDSPIAKVGLDVGDTAGTQRLGKAAVLVADTQSSHTPYALVGGRRYKITSDAVATALNLTGRPALDVGTSYLQGLPAGPDLRTPSIPDVGTPSHQVQLQGRAGIVGQLVHTSDTEQDFLVLDDGVQPVPESLWVQLLRSERDASGAPIPSATASFAAVSGQPQKPASWAAVRSQLAGVPESTPTFSDAPSQNHGVCAVFSSATAMPALALPAAASLPSFHASGVTETAVSRAGQADVVTVSPGRAAVVTASNGSTTISLVAAPGKRFPCPSKDTLNLLGYSGVKPVTVPVQLLKLIPPGSALDTTAARTPTSG
jgi:type VII secretion protein EccB